MKPKAQSVKEKPNILDLIKIKVLSNERQSTDQKKICANHISNKGPTSRIYKELKTQQ